MTTKELIALGNDHPVNYRGQQVMFICLTMNFVPFGSKTEPMRARIRFPNGRELRVFPQQLTAAA